MIFGFFSRWKKAGRAVGVTGGAGKLCAFDADGNVVSAGVTAADVGGKYYRHCIRIDFKSSTDYFPGVVQYEIISKSSAALNTWAKVRDATPTTEFVATGGWQDLMSGYTCLVSAGNRSGSGSSAELVFRAFYYNTQINALPTVAVANSTNCDVSDSVTEIK